MSLTSEKEKLDFMAFYDSWAKLTLGSKAELRRVTQPSDLVTVPAFYRITAGFGSYERIQRLVFCLPYLTHVEDGKSLGRSFAESGISEKRLFSVLRSQPPNDLIQLRRLLQQAKPRINWHHVGEQIYFWNDLSKRRLMEDYFLYQNQSEKNAKA